ncbi:MAG: hypothetical protein IKA04_01985 [Alistipes sp.]|nr:hypothetical protein [Alistipes sp.]
MNKHIDILVQFAQGGFDTVYNRYNKLEGNDLRNHISKLTKTDPDGVMLENGTDGCAVYIWRAIMQSRSNDCYYSVIYIPNDIKIEGGKIKSIIDQVRMAMGSCKEDLNKNILDQLCSESYEEDLPKIFPISTNATASAYRIYGPKCGYSLEELLEKRMQKSYQEFKYIHFIGEENAATLNVDNWVNLTNSPLKSFIKIEPLHTSKSGFIPYKENKPFASPLYMFEGDSLNICWKKEGYKDVCKSATVAKGQHEAFIQEPKEHEIERIFTINDFQISFEGCDNVVYGKKHQSLNYSLRVNNKELTKEEKIFIQESKLDSIPIFLTVNIDKDCDYEYETFNQSMDLRGKPKFNIYVKKKIYKYDFVVEAPSGDSICEFSIEDTKKLNSSPLPGYKAKMDIRTSDYQTNHLTYNVLSRKIWCLLLAVAFLLGLISQPYIARSHKFIKGKWHAYQDDRNLTKACKYLCRETYKEDKMNKVGDKVLLGMYTHLETYNIEKALGVFSKLNNKLDNDKEKFAEAIELKSALDKCKEMNIRITTPKKGNGPFAFLKRLFSSDKIDRKEYIEKLNKEVSKQQPANDNK